MRMPTYLLRSRHNIIFRYPLPAHICLIDSRTG